MCERHIGNRNTINFHVFSLFLLCYAAVFRSLHVSMISCADQPHLDHLRTKIPAMKIARFSRWSSVAPNCTIQIIVRHNELRSALFSFRRRCLKPTADPKRDAREGNVAVYDRSLLYLKRSLSAWHIQTKYDFFCFSVVSLICID